MTGTQIGAAADRTVHSLQPLTLALVRRSIHSPQCTHLVYSAGVIILVVTLFITLVLTLLLLVIPACWPPYASQSVYANAAEALACISIPSDAPPRNSAAPTLLIIIACQEPMPQHAPRIQYSIVSCMSHVLLLLYAAPVQCHAVCGNAASLRSSVGTSRPSASRWLSCLAP
jgi:hypothetical protein